MPSNSDKSSSKESLKEFSKCPSNPSESNQVLEKSISNDSLPMATPSQCQHTRSRIPKLSSCFRSSNSSLESLEYQPKSSKASLRKNSNSSLESVIPSCLRSSDSTYILALEKEYESLQVAFFAVTSHFAKVQFRLRQIIHAKPEERDRLLAELTHVAFCGIDEMELTNMPQMKKDLECMGNIRRRQGCLIDRLRSQLDYLCEDNVPEVEKVGAPLRKSVTIDKKAKK